MLRKKSATVKRRRTRVRLVAYVAWSLGACAIAGASSLAGCSSTEVASGASDAAVEAFVYVAPDAAAPVDASEGGAEMSATTFRVANLSPDLGPIDVCVRLAPSDWVGPIFGQETDASGQGAIAFPSVSGYTSVNGSGAFDIALVAAGALSCGQARAIGHVTLDAGKLSTVVVMGLDRGDAAAPNALTISAFTDDPSTTTAQARSRLIHGALGDVVNPSGTGALSATRTNAGAPSIPLAAFIAPGHAATPSGASPVVDALGYNDSDPSAGASSLGLDGVDAADAGSRAEDASADAAAFSWRSATTTFPMPAGSLHTGFVTSDGMGGVALLWCDDALATPGACTLYIGK